jgi:hypothetical protein
VIIGTDCLRIRVDRSTTCLPDQVSAKDRDSVLAVFGAPVSHEDDAERAVRAGLAIRGGVVTDARGVLIPLHVGINTGEVMAGQIGPAERRQYVAMGDTTNTAARLMSAASPGSVLVGTETFRATSRTVRYREAGPVPAKGKGQPVPAWEALDVSALPEPRLLRTSPLAGRDNEMTVLAGAWAKVSRELRPHLVTILGEPGIGKSRLATEFEQRALSGALMLHGRRCSDTRPSRQLCGRPARYRRRTTRRPPGTSSGRLSRS